MPQLIFIRHAEKPANDDVNLSHKGSLRARYLPEYLLHPYKDFHPPKTAFIMYLRGHNKSDRCRQTMEPTIQSGKLTYKMVHRSKTESLALHISKMNHTVVVCWEHTRIVDFLNLLIGYHMISAWGLNPESCTDDRKCFDATWVCDVDENSVRLRVFRQFEIIDDLPSYPHDRHRVWFDKTYSNSGTLGLQKCVVTEEGTGKDRDGHGCTCAIM